MLINRWLCYFSVGRKRLFCWKYHPTVFLLFPIRTVFAGGVSVEGSKQVRSPVGYWNLEKSKFRPVVFGDGFKLANKNVS